MRYLRYVAALFLYYLGINFIYESIRHFLKGREVRIFVYHRVVNSHRGAETVSQPGIVVSTECFREQVKYLIKKYDVAALGSLPSYLQNSRRRGRVCILTFDDGWRDNYTNAFPILKSFGIPATIFLTTGLVSTDETFWPEKVIEAFLVGEFDELRGAFESMHDDEVREKISGIIALNASAKQKLERIDDLIELLKQKEEGLRNEIIHLLNRGRSRERTILDWNEVVEMNAQGISFGSHTVYHHILTRIPSELAWVELTASKKAIEEKIDEPVLAFAYPNGECNNQVKEMVRDAGYEMAFVLGDGFNDHAVDMFLLQRKNIHEDMITAPWGGFSRCLFACEISGLLDLFKRISRYGK